MIYSIKKTDILVLLKRQISNLFFLDQEEENILEKYYDVVLQRIEICFMNNTNKYYSRNGSVYFDPYMSVQYMTFLYFFANTIFKSNKGSSKYLKLCDKLYYLNKSLNAVDIFYAVNMPDFFMAEHPVGTVIGRAEIGDGLMFYQGCTIGGFHCKNGSIVYPVLGENLRMFANSTIIGHCIIGSNVDIGAGALIKNQSIPSNSIVFGVSPNLVFKYK